MEEIDAEIFRLRDKKIYKPLNTITQKYRTLFGDVYVKKRLYEASDICGEVKQVYLLDEIIGGRELGSWTEPILKILDEMRNQRGYTYAMIAAEVGLMYDLQITRQGAKNILDQYQEYTQKSIKEVVSPNNTTKTGIV